MTSEQAFEKWWESHPLGKSTNLQPIMIQAFKDLAKQAWDAGFEEGWS